MKDLIQVRFTVATAEIKGKSMIAISKVLGKALKKVEPQIMRLIEKSTQVLEKNLDDELQEGTNKPCADPGVPKPEEGATSSK